jgi:hypothetical protein
MCYSGRRVFPFELKVADIDIRDIAHATSMQCRYNGHVIRFYSVAEHMVHISAAILLATGNKTLALQGLLHDAGEAYTGDFTRPVKNSLREVGEVLKAAEDRNEAVIAQRFRLPYPFDPIVKDYDRRIIVNEKSELFGPNKPWDWDLTPLDIIIRAWEPARAEEMYLEQFGKLTGEWFHWMDLTDTIPAN